MSKTYIIERTASGRVEASVWDGEQQRRLRHLVHHSPTGFEYGYAGSGPADLARSIVGDLFETDRPHPAAYQRVKFSLLVDLEGNGPHVIRDSDVYAAVGDDVPKFEPAW